MVAAFLTTIFFSLSAITGNRCARIFGGIEANFYRLCIASLLLGIYAHFFTRHISQSVAMAFMLSGVVGVGVGDLLFFQTLPRLGSRLTVLLIQCLSVPFAAGIEWLWLGTTLHPQQILWVVVILGGIITALLPTKTALASAGQARNRVWISGACFGILAAFGNGFGAVLSRKAYALAKNAGENVDGFSAAHQRVLGGLIVAVTVVLIARWPKIKKQISDFRVSAPETYRVKWRRAWPWVIATSLAGQTFGVTCFQWALKNNPTAVVLPVIATTPLVAIPFTYIFEKERPSWKSVVGGAIAVIGVIFLLRSR